MSVVGTPFVVIRSIENQFVYDTIQDGSSPSNTLICGSGSVDLSDPSALLGAKVFFAGASVIEDIITNSRVQHKEDSTHYIRVRVSASQEHMEVVDGQQTLPAMFYDHLMPPEISSITNWCFVIQTVVYLNLSDHEVAVMKMVGLPLLVPLF